MVAIDVNHSDYRESLSYRNIYIECAQPPAELMRRAREVIERPRESPEMDDAAVLELIETTCRLQTENENAIERELAPKIIPAMSQIPDERLAGASKQLWSRAIPIPLLPGLLDVPSLLLLPRPNPDLVFGYSKLAFTAHQGVTMLHLVEDESRQSYAMPDRKTLFPFLTIEFRSQAKHGTHYVAMNQTAGAGAIALSGYLELLRRSRNAEAFDMNSPRFFSLTIDQVYAQINVHWVSGGPKQGEPYAFHVKRVARHFLDNAEGIRAVSRAVKNILDYGLDTLLPSICEALDAYMAAIVAARQME